MISRIPPAPQRKALCCLLLGLVVSLAVHADESSILFEASYGERLPGSTSEVEVWWAHSGWKVAKSRPAPTKSGEAIRIGAAQHEYDAAQLVVRPARPLAGFTAKASDLNGPDGAVLEAVHVEVLRVRYVNVTRQTDSWSAAAPWPDPLPPFQGPIDLAANENQPLWVRVYVPRGTPPGEYAGSVELSAEGYEAQVPLHVRVYGFELPDRMTLYAMMGFYPDHVYTYHGLQNEEQHRQVLEKYWTNLSRHHITPYNPAPLDPVTVEWVKRTEDEVAGLPAEDGKLLREHPLTPRFDWSAWDKEMVRVFDKFHWTAFRLKEIGLSPASLQGFEKGTRGYELAYTAYYHTLQEHLRDVGLLDAAMLYCVDEPRPKQYDSVRAGFEQLKKAAPDLNRFLTEQVEPELVGGPNIWCVLPNHYDYEGSHERRRAGDRFWWYVCTGPKQPYPGLFTDHPGTDLRVWLWQSWKYEFEGILVWRLNRWTYKGVYADHPQNPYEDPMSWTRAWKEGLPPHPYGNGDGMFLYPPEAAAGVAETPCFDDPVDSIRWEMIRDGIEDFEYFVILKRLLQERSDALSERKRKYFERLLTVPDGVTSEITLYTKDPAPIEKHRDRVAQAIEELVALD